MNLNPHTTEGLYGATYSRRDHQLQFDTLTVPDGFTADETYRAIVFPVGMFGRFCRIARGQQTRKAVAQRCISGMNGQMLRGIENGIYRPSVAVASYIVTEGLELPGLMLAFHDPLERGPLLAVPPKGFQHVVGAHFQERREDLGLTQYQAADKLEISQSAISAFERADPSIPRPATIAKYFHKLWEVSVGYVAILDPSPEAPGQPILPSS